MYTWTSHVSPHWLVACPDERFDRSLWRRSPHTLCILAGTDPHNPPSTQTQPGLGGDGGKSMHIYECVSVWVRGKGVGVKRQHWCIIHKKNRWILNGVWVILIYTRGLTTTTCALIFKGPLLVLSGNPQIPFKFWFQMKSQPYNWNPDSIILNQHGYDTGQKIFHLPETVGAAQVEEHLSSAGNLWLGHL